MRSFLLHRFWSFCLFQVLAAPGVAPDAQASDATPSKPVLRLYVYDSFASKGGLGEDIIPGFELRCGCKVELLPSGDASQMLTRVAIDVERGRPAGQLMVGVDQVLLDRAKPLMEPWGTWTPAGWNELLPIARKEIPAKDVLPFDYGPLAMMADLKQVQVRFISPLPVRLRDLLRPELKRGVLLQDPRTSSPGLIFLLYTVATLGQDAPAFWREMKKQWLTLPLGWDAAYGLFLKEKAPFVWSYLSSQAYHVEHGDPAMTRFKALFFEEGQPLQVEVALQVKGAIRSETDRKLAREFLEYLISPGVQEKIPVKNWMWPVRRLTYLPESYRKIAFPSKWVSLPRSSEEIRKAIELWERAR